MLKLRIPLVLISGLSCKCTLLIIPESCSLNSYHPEADSTAFLNALWVLAQSVLRRAVDLHVDHIFLNGLSFNLQSSIKMLTRFSKLNKIRWADDIYILVGKHGISTEWVNYLPWHVYWHSHQEITLSQNTTNNTCIYIKLHLQLPITLATMQYGVISGPVQRFSI